MTPSPSSDSVREVKTSKDHPARPTGRLLVSIGVLASALMVALTLGVSAKVGAAGAALWAPDQSMHAPFG